VGAQTLLVPMVQNADEAWQAVRPGPGIALEPHPGLPAPGQRRYVRAGTD